MRLLISGAFLGAGFKVEIDPVYAGPVDPITAIEEGELTG